MGTVMTVLPTLAGGAFGWIALLILGQPIIRFFELRRDTREQMLYSANIPAPKEGAEVDTRFEVAHDVLRPSFFDRRERQERIRAS